MKTYELKYPILVPAQGDKPEYEIKTLNLPDRMKTKHAKLIPDDNFNQDALNPAKFVPVVASMANLDLKTAEEIDFVDMINLVKEIISPFLSELGTLSEN